MLSLLSLSHRCCLLHFPPFFRSGMGIIAYQPVCAPAYLSAIEHSAQQFVSQHASRPQSPGYGTMRHSPHMPPTLESMLLELDAAVRASTRWSLGIPRAPLWALGRSALPQALCDRVSSFLGPSPRTAAAMAGVCRNWYGLHHRVPFAAVARRLSFGRGLARLDARGCGTLGDVLALFLQRLATEAAARHDPWPLCRREHGVPPPGARALLCLGGCYCCYWCCYEGIPGFSANRRSRCAEDDHVFVRGVLVPTMAPIYAHLAWQRELAGGPPDLRRRAAAPFPPDAFRFEPPPWVEPLMVREEWYERAYLYDGPQALAGRDPYYRCHTPEVCETVPQQQARELAGLIAGERVRKCELFPAVVDRFYSPSQFGFLAPLQAEWRGVLAEFEAVRAAHWDRFVQFGETKGWRVFGLQLWGLALGRNCALAPRTCALLAAVPALTTAGFSVLGPGTHIRPHTAHAGTAGVRCHLGLDVPAAGCAFRVADQVVGWEAGRLLVFNAAAPHEAVNFSGAPRAVLLLDWGGGRMPRKDLPTWIQASFAAAEGTGFELDGGKRPGWHLRGGSRSG